MDIQDNNQRDSNERRKSSWKTVFFGFIKSRRSLGRRESESDLIFSDWTSPKVVFIAAGIMIMSALDAFFTLELLQRGFYEANPIIAVIMVTGVFNFVAFKMIITGVAVLILTYLARVTVFRFIRVSSILNIAFGIYSILISYELYFLFIEF